MRALIIGIAAMCALAGLIFGYTDRSLAPDVIAASRNVFGVAVFVVLFTALLSISGRTSDVLSTLLIALAVIGCWFVTNQTAYSGLVPPWFAQGMVQGVIAALLVILWTVELLGNKSSAR